MAETLAGSESTWRTSPLERSSTSALREPKSSGFARVRQIFAQQRVRERWADAVATDSLRPDEGMPIAPFPVVRAYFWRLLGRVRWQFVAVLVVTVCSTLATMVAPMLIGRLTDKAIAGLVTADELGWWIAGIAGSGLVGAILYGVTGGLARQVGHIAVAEVREEAVDTVVSLSLGDVERASTGDLVTRVTRDADELAKVMGWALPALLVSTTTVAIAVAATLANSWLLAIPSVVCGLFLAWSGYVYLTKALAGSLWRGQAESDLNATINESCEAARVVASLQLEDDRRAKVRENLEVCGQSERYLLGLRLPMWVLCDVNVAVPILGIVLIGVVGLPHGWVTVGQMTAAILYSQQVAPMMDRAIHALDRVQSATASLSRILGIGLGARETRPGDATPNGADLRAHDVRFAYREGTDVLHGIDLDLRPGERLAIVGPTGSGKSTLGRLFAGIHPPRTGSVTVGDAEVVRIPLERLRSEVALVTQEHHVFAGSLRDNVGLARLEATDDEVATALDAVDARWWRSLADGLDTTLGKGFVEPTPAQAQQIALARLVLLNPHTLILDEATSLIDPRTARHLESSMSALLGDRTVVAIAHRLHTAHDADRIAVVIDGRIVELGSHDELIAREGEYASLWRAWTS